MSKADSVYLPWSTKPFKSHLPPYCIKKVSYKPLQNPPNIRVRDKLCRLLIARATAQQQDPSPDLQTQGVAGGGGGGVNPCHSAAEHASRFLILLFTAGGHNP